MCFVYCERSKQSFVKLANKQGQIILQPWIWDGRRYAFCLHHFFVGGYKTLVMDEVRYPMYFCPKNIWVCWRWTLNFGIVKQAAVALNF